MVKKYVNPRVSGYRDDSHAIRDIGVFGAEARSIVSAVTGVSCDVLGALAPYGHLDAQLEARSVTIARVTGPRRSRDTSCSFHSRCLIACGSERSMPARRRRGSRAWEIARVEAGRVRVGDRHRRLDHSAGSELRRVGRDLVHEGLLHRARGRRARPLPRPCEPAFARAARRGHRRAAADGRPAH